MEITGLDRAVEYVQKLEHFRSTFERADSGCNTLDYKVMVETGRKFDRVFVKTKTQKLGRYFVDRNSWIIYGIKSWNQVNERRQYGTLDTVDEWDWSFHYATPIAGTKSETLHNNREEEIARTHRPRGRPKKNP